MRIYTGDEPYLKKIITTGLHSLYVKQSGKSMADYLREFERMNAKESQDITSLTCLVL